MAEPVPGTSLWMLGVHKQTSLGHREKCHLWTLLQECSSTTSLLLRTSRLHVSDMLMQQLTVRTKHINSRTRLCCNSVGTLLGKLSGLSKREELTEQRIVVHSVSFFRRKQVSHATKSCDERFLFGLCLKSDIQGKPKHWRLRKILASSSLGGHHETTINKLELYRHVFPAKILLACAHTVSLYDGF